MIQFQNKEFLINDHFVIYPNYYYYYYYYK